MVLKPAVGPLRAVCVLVPAFARASDAVVQWGYSQEPAWEAHSVLTFFPKMGSEAFCWESFLWRSDIRLGGGGSEGARAAGGQKIQP